jgi:hypothetical protein
MCGDVWAEEINEKCKAAIKRGLQQKQLESMKGAMKLPNKCFSTSISQEKQ